jgi:hypothetical protein
MRPNLTYQNDDSVLLSSMTQENMGWMSIAERLRKSRDPSASSVSSRIYNFFVSVSRHSSESLIDLACVTALIGYFLHFALPSLRGGFGADEPMNMYFYWHPGILRCLWANVCFWSDFYRPAGALYYLPLYHFFYLNPEPYRIVQVSIVGTSIPIIYWLCRLLTTSRSVAFLGTIIVSYHADLANLVFRGSMIYDALCGLFYFAALAYYIHVRGKGINLRPLQVAIFLLLYICALNSKEMAVSLPLIALTYEVLKCPGMGNWKLFVLRNWRCAIPPLIAGVLTAVYIYGKTHGSNSLITHDVYRPQYSWHTFLASNAEFVSELRFDHRPVLPVTLLFLWAGVFVYAFIRRDRTLQLMAFWVVLVPLPIAFIYPIRGGACLYLLLFGWAIILAKFVSDLIILMLKYSTSLGQAVGVGVAIDAAIGTVVNHRARGAAIGAAMGAVIGACAAKLPPRKFRACAVTLVVFGVAIVTQWENQRLGRAAGILESGQRTVHAIETFRSLNLQPVFGSNILLKSTFPFKNKWTPLFIASLVWNDHSLQIWLEGKNKLTPQQVAKVNYIISFTESGTRLLRSPELPQP